MSSFRKTIFSLFFLSGFCGLLYQVVWMRLAFAHFGIITPVLSVVVSVFMLGLSLGSWLGGWLISRRGAQRFSAAYAYGLIEALIGLSAVAVPKLFPVGAAWLLPGGEMNSVSYLGFSALIIALSILPWCVLMGMTFPFMMAFIRQREAGDTTSFSFLYLANVIGAMAGTILTADVLVELLGFRHTLMVAGATNILIAAISFLLGARSAHQPAEASGRKAFLAEPIASILSPAEARWAYLILFMTGFTSMSLEVIWVRDFTPVLGTTIYAFATIVAVYLLATWMGSSRYRKQAAQGRFPTTAGLLAALAATSLLCILVNDPRLNLKKIGVVLGIFPFSFLLGYLTPGLIDRIAAGNPDRAGRAYAVNIIGCILGPLAASYLFLPYLGVKQSMVWMAVPYIVLMLFQLGHMTPKLRWQRTVTALGLLFLAISVTRSYEERYMEGVVRRDATATVISIGKGMDKRLLVNGVGITSLATVTKVMAHFPLALIEKPKSALDICFGMGTTYRSLLTWPGVNVIAVELVPSVKQAVGYYHADAEAVMANPRGRVVIDDGRRFLSRTSQTFDVVTIDPPPPIEAAGSSLLYTQEFYELIKQRLAPQGVLQQWFPGGQTVEAHAITRSLTNAFPYVRVFIHSPKWGIHFIASKQPIKIPSVKAALARLPAPARKDLVEWESNQTPEQIFQQIWANEVSVKQLLAADPQIVITDDRPFNEYYLLRRNWKHYFGKS